MLEDVNAKLDQVLENQVTLLGRLNSLEDSLATVATDRLWSTDEVAHRLKVKRATVHTWAHRGQIQAVKQGRRSLIPDSELKKLVKNGGVPIIKSLVG